MENFKIYTLGCKVNQYESQVIRQYFIRRGLEESNNGCPCDIYIINTCTVTKDADRKSYSYIRRALRENPSSKVYVTGCLVKTDKQRIKDSFPGISLFNKEKLKQGISDFKGHHRAFIKIQDGCRNFCSYCKVPVVRNIIKSRPVGEITREAAGLIEAGFKEIVLCGICLGAYGRDLKIKIDLTDAIEAVENIKGNFRIRLSSIEAGDVSEKLIRKMEVSKRLCPHLHIPLQSADNRILKLMNRHYTAKKFLNLIKKLKQRIPDFAFTTDVLVGFPSESESNFQNTFKLIKEIEPLRVHIFPFSAREGTRAFSMKEKNHEQVIHNRVKRLRDLTKELSLLYRSRFLGKELMVLSEGKGGYAQNYIEVKFGPEINCPGELIKTAITTVSKDHTLGKPIFKKAFSP